MNTNEIRFLPIEIIDTTLNIKEPYIDELIIFLDKNKIEFTYVEASIKIPTLKTDEGKLDSIIKLIKKQRYSTLQKAIRKNYL